MSKHTFHGHDSNDYLQQQFMKRLQYHHDTNVSQKIMTRIDQAFNAEAVAQPIFEQDRIAFFVYPQNPFVNSPAIRYLSVANAPGKLANHLFVIQDSREVEAQPDASGNFIFDPGTPEFDQANAFYYAMFTHQLVERYAHRPLVWSFTNQPLIIDPYAGDQANAYYDEVNHKVGFHTYTFASGEKHSTAQSADIVTHEVAHALLDGIRDLYNESFGLGARSFHESFGDMIAVLVALHDDNLINQLLERNDADLRQSNFVSEIAEHLASALHGQEAYVLEQSLYLRNAFNSFVYQDFDTLPYRVDDPNTTLGRQEHNYSRILTGFFYDVLVDIYDEYRANTHPIIALYRARDIVGELLMFAIDCAPIGEVDFKDFGRAFITASNLLFDDKYNDILKKNLIKRNLISDEAFATHIESMNTYPTIMLSDSVKDKATAQVFLQETLLPQLDIEPEQDLMPFSYHKDKRGFTVLSFFEIHTLTLEGDDYKGFVGSNIQVYGGLTVAFNADGHLCHMIYRPPTEQDFAQIQVIIHEMIDMDRIATELRPITQLIRPIPTGLHIEEESTQQARLVTYPIIIDDIASDIEPLRTSIRDDD